jgi:hypothetical protein
MRGGLAEIEQALERYGLLLAHDGELPSVTLIVAGEPIRGSWWGHTLGHTIYDLLGAFQDRSGKLDAKIIDGKVTYVHPRLWPAFLALAQHAPEARLAKLPPAAVALYRHVERHGPIRADALPPTLTSAPRELTKNIRALESALLVHSDSIHTESGAHVKLLQTWPQWCGEQQVRVPAVAIADARAELDRALLALCAGTTRKPKVPW